MAGVEGGCGRHSAVGGGERGDQAGGGEGDGEFEQVEQAELRRDGWLISRRLRSAI